MGTESEDGRCAVPSYFAQLAPPLIATHESMKILVLGAGRMGSLFVDLLSFHHEVAVFETDAQKLRFVYHALRFSDRNEIRDFAPELLINAVPLKHTPVSYTHLTLPTTERV